MSSPHRLSHPQDGAQEFVRNLRALEELVPGVDVGDAIDGGPGWDRVLDRLEETGQYSKTRLEGDAAIEWALDRQAEGKLDADEVEEIRQSGGVGFFHARSELARWALARAGYFE